MASKIKHGQPTVKLARKTTKTITIDDLVAENLVHLRVECEGLSRPAFLEEILPYGVKMSEHQLWLTEKGRRPLKASELMGMALFFNVPPAYFFWPPAMYLDREVKVGREKIPAYQLLHDTLFPPNQDFDPYDRALHIAAEAAQEYGQIEAVKKLQEAALEPRRSRR